MQRAPVLLFLAWTCFLFFSAIGLFTSGFLLMRVELANHSSCSDALASPFRVDFGSCWLPWRFSRAILLIIDALKFEFARFDPSLREPHPYENKLGFLHELAIGQPRYGRLFRFRADPPTTTMQRIKGFTTGSLPTFIDAGSNFASYAIQEDNLVWQMAQNGKRVVFMGDDTWDGLFPGAFFRSYFFPSFNVKDLHTVDDGILQHLYQTVDGGEWDLLIAHFLGVDHCGHKHGPDHPEMAKKLSQMDEVLRSLVDHLANDTLLLVAGDHGMTGTGDHGGDTEEEVNAALFVYSKVPLFRTPPPQEPQTVPQVNLVPTLALLLGIPVPYSNIGEVMDDLFATEGDTATSVLAQLAAYNVNARQVDRFLHTYSLAAQDIPAEKLGRLQSLFSATVEEHEQVMAQAGFPELPQLERLRGQFRRYLREARAVCAESWARFHPVRMVSGCALLTSSCLLCYIASRVSAGLSFSYRRLLWYPFLWGAAGAAGAGAMHLSGVATTDLLLLCSWAAAASQVGFFWHCWAGHAGRSHAASARLPFGGLGLRQRLRVGLVPALGILLLRCGAMFSDSFVMAEGQVVPFLLMSLVLLFVLGLHWNGRLREGSTKSWWVLGFLGIIVLTARLSGLFQQCREETPACRSSTLLAPLSKLQDPQAKNLSYALCLAVLASLAWGMRCWMRHYGNLNSPSAPVCFVRWGFPLLALGVGGFWAVTSGSEDDLAKLHAWVQLALVSFPRGVFALGAVGLLLLLCDPVTVFVRDSRNADPAMGAPIVSPSSQAELLHVIPQLYRRMQETLRSRLDAGKDRDRATVEAYGLGSVYSAALLIFLALLGFLLMMLHSERLSLAFLLLFLEAFVLLWMQAYAVALSSSTSSSESDPFSVPWSAVVAWALAAAQFFYATGHQPVFPTIHWNAAFVGFHQGHDSTWLPALLVGANTFSSHILFAVGCPLLLLWPFLCEMPRSKGGKPKAEVSDREEQMMEMRLREAPEKFSAALLQLGLKYQIVLGAQLLACVLAAIILRRHLMVWKVFAPKFLFEAVGFVVSNIFLLLGIGLVMRVDCAVSAWFKRVILAQSR
ncbi:GPI ethanolamine phosphate transferase 3 [Anolis carolinensis]|uniref:GPI ethanolamine phosphate transferase 3 n=1 Tax=Anolis carolinensis TaxID=28377 RepID=UPI002F2B290A